MRNNLNIHYFIQPKANPNLLYLTTIKKKFRRTKLFHIIGILDVQRFKPMRHRVVHQVSHDRLLLPSVLPSVNPSHSTIVNIQ